MPGHKGGRGNKEFRDFIGLDAMQMDVNSMKPLDNLCHPTSVIKEAQDIAAEAFWGKRGLFCGKWDDGGCTGYDYGDLQSWR